MCGTPLVESAPTAMNTTSVIENATTTLPGTYKCIYVCGTPLLESAPEG